MPDILEKLSDLHKEATEERSHHYTGAVIAEAIAEITRLQLYAPSDPEAVTVADYEKVLADHRRLVRELDVALNGEAAAARQASLCDIVGQITSGEFKMVKAGKISPGDQVRIGPNPQVYVVGRLGDVGADVVWVGDDGCPHTRITAIAALTKIDGELDVARQRIGTLTGALTSVCHDLAEFVDRVGSPSHHSTLRFILANARKGLGAAHADR